MKKLACLAMLLAVAALPVRAADSKTSPSGSRTESAVTAGKTPAPENFPRNAYEQAMAQGKPVFRIDPARSLVAITVRSGGFFARLGHDHVVASRVPEGYISPEERPRRPLRPIERTHGR